MRHTTRKVITGIHLRDLDWEVEGMVTPGTPPRPWAYGGEGDPGDPGEVTDITLRGDGHPGRLDEQDLDKDEIDSVIEALSIACDDN